MVEVPYRRSVVQAGIRGLKGTFATRKDVMLSHWTSNLRGSRAPGPEIDWLSLDGDRIRANLGDGAVEWAIEIGDEIAHTVLREVPELGEGAATFNTLRRATTSMALRALVLISGLDRGRESLATTEAVEGAREFASHGVELTHMLRGIRIGYAILARALLDAAAALVPEHDSSDQIQRVSIRLFEVIDQFTDVATTEFLQQQRDQAASISAAQFDLVKRIVEGSAIDSHRAKEILGYPLDKSHIAVIAWTESSAPPARHDSRMVLNPVFAHWRATGPTLIIPVGSHVVWGWSVVIDTGHRFRGPVPEIKNRCVAVGQIGKGIDGFRRSHLEAQAVERLMRLQSTSNRKSQAHEDVDLELLLLSDPSTARTFVARHLGRLATDDPRMASLRATLRHYLELDRSLAKVADIESVSRNTVTYRVQQALKICHHPADEPTVRLHAALIACDWLTKTRDSRSRASGS